MVIDTIINRSVAGQILIFDGWFQIENDDAFDVWWKKDDLCIVIKPNRPYGINVAAVDSTFENHISGTYFCGNIVAFSQAMTKLKLTS